MLAVVLALAFAVYASTLRDWFTGDDFWFLKAAHDRDLSWSYIVRCLDFRNTGSSLEFDRYRPLYPIIWRVQYSLFGMNALYYHAVVLVMHLFSVVLVWWIARRLFAEGWASNLAALIFALHPVYADSVAWLSGANRVFEALPYFGCLLLFMKSRDAGERHRALCYGGSVVLFVVAVLFHSSALSLVAVLPGYGFLLAGRPADALRPRAWLPYVPFIAVTAVLTGIQYWVRANLPLVELGFHFGFHQYTNYAIFLAMTLSPLDPTSYHGAFRTLLEILRGAASLIMLGATFALLARRPVVWLGVFATLWLYASLLPDSTFILGAFGRVLYTPGGAMAIFIVAAILWMRDALPPDLAARATRVFPAVVAIGVVMAAVIVVGRVRATSHDASANQQFADALQQRGPRVPAGGTLYLDGAPRNLMQLGDTRLIALVQLQYGNTPVRPVHAAADLEALGPDDRLFRYTP
jgi:hypothetical protein